MRRELHEIEYFNWCVGQPYNMVIAVKIRGDVRPDRLRVALDKAQRRHPLLGVNTEIGPRGLPWFSSEGVGVIPLTVVDGAEPDAAQKLVETELTSRFAMDRPESPRLPLLRVALLVSREAPQTADLVFTVQHVVADGFSMVFVVRDLLCFMEEPDAPVAILDAAANDEDVLPAEVRRRIPRSARRFKLALALAKLYARLRLGRSAPAREEHVQHHRSWELTVDQTRRLRDRCRREGVSVQSAICTAFLPGFGAVHTPVNLRPLLARPVGESVGLFVGSADIRMKYRASHGFWGNARRFHRKLRRALRDPFAIFRLFSKAVPAKMVRELGPLLVRIMSRQRPLAVTNLGDLDGNGLHLQGRDLKIESFLGAVTGIVDSSVVTVYTIDGRMRLHVLATEPGLSDTTIRDEADRAVKRLLDAVD
jgi:hypothetical protein